jgi:hypothetical protein
MVKKNIVASFPVSERVKTAVQWEQATEDVWKNGIRVIINHFKEVKQVTPRKQAIKMSG